MARPGEESSNGSHRLFQTIAAENPEEDVIHISLRELCEMAHLEGECSNTLFEVLSEWERHLAQLDH